MSLIEQFFEEAYLSAKPKGFDDFPARMPWSNLNYFNLLDTARIVPDYNKDIIELNNALTILRKTGNNSDVSILKINGEIAWRRKTISDNEHLLYDEFAKWLSYKLLGIVEFDAKRRLKDTQIAKQ